MADHNTNNRKVMLTKPEDWDPWISIIKSVAVPARIWDKINPDISPKPATLDPPVAPAKPRILNGNGDFDEGAFQHWKALQSFYNADVVEYNKEFNALQSITNIIFTTCSADTISLINHTDEDPWSKLVALKQRLRPTDTCRKIQLEKRYRELAQGPTNQDVETWIRDWTKVCYEGKILQIGECQDDRPIRDFLLAIATIDNVYASGREQSREDLKYIITFNAGGIRQRSLEDEIEMFRNHILLRQTSEARKSSDKDSHSAFATQSDQASFKGQRQKEDKENIPTCVCGRKQWYSDCWYLNKEIASPKWKENLETRKKVDKALQNPKVKAQVEKALAKRKGDSTGAGATPDSPTALITAFESSDRSLRPWLILDSAANGHVCNKESAHLYTKERDAPPDLWIGTGSGRSEIESYGTIRTMLKTPTRLEYVEIRDVAYAANFSTSLIALAPLKQKGLHFDSEMPRLHKKGNTVYHLFNNGAFNTFTKEGPGLPWAEKPRQALSTTTPTPSTKEKSQKEQQIRDLPTPEPSLSPQNTLSVDEDMFLETQLLRHRRKNAAPQAGTISAEFDTDNVLPEGVKRQRKTRQDAYVTQLEAIKNGSLDVFHDSFMKHLPASIYRDDVDSRFAAIALTTQKTSQRQHRDNLLPEPKGLKELAHHPHAEFFKQEMRTEIEILRRKNTWKEVSMDVAQQAGKKPIPTMWVFKYKFDESGYLLKHKVRLVARGDRQYTETDTFAATLAARIFRALMDLETRQFDAVNAFVNSRIDEPAFHQIPPRWLGSQGILLMLLRALYSLKGIIDFMFCTTRQNLRGCVECLHDATSVHYATNVV